ncbi:uncharacterized protein LOC115682118 isoform X1 [Syzygium oleosum]|uniref:uncharacterized protein LOC115682118 isoform X1 n=1 Tax=Syzygium oleosum TaxID=219896 RepID=UPI0024B87A9D|nr:uncharacterized protein LOC115682118 isoform X1 [Syzygium oleosum]
MELSLAIFHPEGEIILCLIPFDIVHLGFCGRLAEEKITRKVNMEGKCIQKVLSQDLNDFDTSEAPLESLCNACRIKSRRKRRAVMNKIGVEITKAKRSNSINGGSLKRRVLTRGREVLMQRPSSYLSEVESHLK